MKENTLFISWHLSRRTISLSEFFKAPVVAIQPEGNHLKRFSICTIWTLKNLVMKRPSVIFLQYSFLLLIILNIYKIISSQKALIINDCHTKSLKRSANGVLGRIFLALKKWSFKKTDLCLIHNYAMTKEIIKFTTKFIVLHDPIPNITPPLPQPRNRHRKIFDIIFVCSFDKDEPIESIFKAGDLLANNYTVAITGRLPTHIDIPLPQKAVLTGFLSNDDYIRTLSEASVISGLTNDDDSLQCSAFEAMALDKPFVTSKTKVLTSLLSDAAIYVDNTPESICDGVVKAIKDSRRLKINIEKNKLKLQKKFEENAKTVVKIQKLQPNHKNLLP